MAAPKTRILMRGSTAELRIHFVEQRDLALVDLAASIGEIEPGGAVNLRKLPNLARAGVATPAGTSCFEPQRDLGRKPAIIEDAHVVLDDGTRLDADLVVMGVGAFMESSALGIFAAGDIARFPYALAGGGSVRIEHWVVAERQGQIAAMNMLGRREKYEQAPFFWSQHYEVPINYVGHAEAWDSTEVVGAIQERDGLVHFRKDGRMLAVASISRDRENLTAELELEGSRQKAASLLT